MRKELPGGFELDDEPGRIDRREVHRFISEESSDAHGLYGRFGFEPPSDRMLERKPA